MNTLWRKSLIDDDDDETNTKTLLFCQKVELNKLCSTELSVRPRHWWNSESRNNVLPEPERATPRYRDQPEPSWACAEAASARSLELLLLVVQSFPIKLSKKKTFTLLKPNKRKVKPFKKFSTTNKRWIKV